MTDPVSTITAWLGTSWLPVALGAVLILAGRRLYRLALAGAGFVLGWTLPGWLALDASPEATLLFALLLGFAGAIATLFVERIAIALAGFVLGGLATLWLFSALGSSLAGPQALLVIAGAVIGLFAFRRIFGAALVVASSLLGAGLVVASTDLDTTASAALLLGLFLFGLLAQRGSGSGADRRERRRSRATARAT